MGWITITLYTLAGLLAIPTVPTISFILIQYRRTSLVPAHLPWAGLKNKRLFPKTRAMMREYAAKRTPITEGYAQFSAHGKPFVLPTMHWPDVALPPSCNAWLISQPDSVLSTVKTQDDLLELGYLGHGPDLAAVHDFSVITRDLTRQMGRLLPALMEELEACFEGEFGGDGEEWKEAELYETIELAARRGVNRLFVGELCRDKEVMDRLLSAGIAIAACGALLRTFVPSFLKAWLAPIICAPYFYQAWRLKRLLLPTITSRMQALQTAVAANEKPTPKARENAPNDGIQWILASAHNPNTNTFALSPTNIAGKTLLLNFFALFTTSITSGTVLLDILLHSPSPDRQTPANPSNASLLSQLRAEAAAILPKLKDDPTAVRQMHKLDSVIRESLRHNPMFARGIQREVVQPGGVTTPDGLYLPRGTHVCAVIAPMQHDSSAANTPEADEFQPLRFYKAPDTTTTSTSTQEKQLGATQISPTFLSFSLGKHACPGRFFAVQTMKVMIGWLLVHYDFEVVFKEGKEGEVEWLEVGEARLPPMKEKGMVRVRRRSGGEGDAGERREEADALV